MMDYIILQLQASIGRVWFDSRLTSCAWRVANHKQIYIYLCNQMSTNFEQSILCYIRSLLLSTRKISRIAILAIYIYIYINHVEAEGLHLNPKYTSMIVKQSSLKGECLSMSLLYIPAYLETIHISLQKNLALSYFILMLGNCILHYISMEDTR